MDRSSEAIIPFRNTIGRYGSVAQALHWAVVLLVALQFPLGITAHGLPLSLLRLKLLVWHKSIGMTVFALMLVRLGWRLYTPAPALPPTLQGRQRQLAHVSHWLLYALLLVMPLVGWITSSASNLTVTWFGLFRFPDLVAPDKALAEAAKDTHIALSWLLLALIGLHVTATFWHEFKLKDGVLRRMLPLLEKETP